MVGGEVGKRFFLTIDCLKLHLMQTNNDKNNININNNKTMKKVTCAASESC